jgi:hypothetical protein
MTHSKPTAEQAQAIRNLIRNLPDEAQQPTRILTALAVAAMIRSLYRGHGWEVPRLAQAFIMALKFLPRQK